jgi:hypothetical protein
MSAEKAKPQEAPVAGKATREALYQLRDLTRRTGLVYEPQALQLQHYPYCLFPIDEARIEPDDQERTLIFSLRLNDALPTGEDLERRIEALESWCWGLLGDEWLVRIETRKKRGGKAKLLHKGRRKAVFAPAKQPEGAVVDVKRYRSLDKAAAFAAVSSETLDPIIIPRKS